MKISIYKSKVSLTIVYHKSRQYSKTKVVQTL